MNTVDALTTLSQHQRVKEIKSNRDALWDAADALVAVARDMYPGANNRLIQSACQCAITLVNEGTTITSCKKG